MDDLIKSNFQEAQNVLKAFSEDNEQMARIKSAGDLMVASLKNGGKIISCGNGGSMTQCEAYDASKIAHGSSLITGHGACATALALAARIAGTGL